MGFSSFLFLNSFVIRRISPNNFNCKIGLKRNKLYKAYKIKLDEKTKIYLDVRKGKWFGNLTREEIYEEIKNLKGVL